MTEEQKKPLSLKSLEARLDNLPKTDTYQTLNLDELITRIELLEKLVLKMAHMAGTAHSTIRDSELTPYNPQKSEMSKFNKKAS